MPERILVAGAGVIDGVTAAHLTRAGHSVVALDAESEHTALLRSPGLCLEELPGSNEHHPEHCCRRRRSSCPAGRFHLAVVTVKSLAGPGTLQASTDARWSRHPSVI
jgi:2-dehydropantoate 2-reductase